MANGLDLIVPGLGLATSVVGNIVGGIAQGQIADKQQKALEGEKAYSENLFNKDYYQDVLKRSENASMLRQLDKNQREMSQRAQKTAAITGATPEAVAAQDKNSSDIYASAVNRMAATASQRKDQALYGYNARRSALFGAQNSVDEAKKAAWGTFMGNANNLGAASLLSGTNTPSAAGLSDSEYNSLAEKMKEGVLMSPQAIDNIK